MKSTTIILDCQNLVCDLRDQILALETLDHLLSLSCHSVEQIDSDGVSRLLRAITAIGSQQLEKLDSLLENLKDKEGNDD